MLILQNSEVEGPGYLLEWAKKAGLPWELCQPFTGENLPQTGLFSHILVLGSPHSVQELPTLPWLQLEADWLRALLHSHQRILGICLGSQLLAHLLGGSVQAGPEVEIGWHTLEWTSDAAAWGLSGSPFPLFQWHQEVFSLPAGAIPLALSPACPLQAFVWQGRVWAMGGHLEMDEKLVSDFVRAFWRGNSQGAFVQAPEQMLGLGKAKLAASRAGVDAFLNAWAAL